MKKRKIKADNSSGVAANMMHSEKQTPSRGGIIIKPEVRNAVLQVPLRRSNRLNGGGDNAAIPLRCSKRLNGGREDVGVPIRRSKRLNGGREDAAVPLRCSKRLKGRGTYDDDDASVSKHLETAKTASSFLETGPPGGKAADSATISSLEQKNDFDFSGEKHGGASIDEITIKDQPCSRVKLSKSKRKRTYTSRHSDSQQETGRKSGSVSLKGEILSETGMSADKVSNEMGPLRRWCKRLSTPTINVSSSRSWEREVVPDPENLPFTKESPLWKEVETWEVFQKFSQKPHFHSLKSEKEISREGLAISKMVTFAKAVTRIKNLKHDDPKSEFDCILEVLSELEKDGFEIIPLKVRLNELSSSKAYEDQLKVKVNDLQSKMIEHIAEKKALDEKIMNEQAEVCNGEEEIEEIANKIKEFEKQMARSRSAKERKESEVVNLKSLKMDKDTEIAKLTSEMDILSQVIQTSQRNFQRLNSAPWDTT